MQRPTGCLLWLRLLLVGSLLLVQGVVWADPPGRVARISWLDGSSEVRVDSGANLPAVVNWSLTSGNVVTTGRFARAEIRVGSTAIRLDDESELEIVQLDDEQIRLNLRYGTLSASVSNVAHVKELSLDTPKGYVLWQAVGRVRVKVGVRPGSVNLNVFSGQVQFNSEQTELVVRAGHAAEFYEENISTQLATLTDFDRWGESRDQLLSTARTTLRYVSSEVTGYEDLERNGYWRESTEYGAVWQPSNQDFMPYRDGRWMWVSPWGWTWIDHAPWAYVTSHYGRWVWLDRRWAWVPGQIAKRPTWSPALVGWVRDGDTVLMPGSGGKTGWFPLGPREVFVPWYAASQVYVRRVNHYYLPPNYNGHIHAPGHYQNRDHLHYDRQNQFVRTATVAVEPTPVPPRPPRVAHTGPAHGIAPGAPVAVRNPVNQPPNPAATLNSGVNPPQNPGANRPGATTINRPVVGPVQTSPTSPSPQTPQAGPTAQPHSSPPVHQNPPVQPHVQPVLPPQPERTARPRQPSEAEPRPRRAEPEEPRRHAPAVNHAAPVQPAAAPARPMVGPTAPAASAAQPPAPRVVAPQPAPPAAAPAAPQPAPVKRRAEDDGNERTRTAREGKPNEK